MRNDAWIVHDAYFPRTVPAGFAFAAGTVLARAEVTSSACLAGYFSFQTDSTSSLKIVLSRSRVLPFRKCSPALRGIVLQHPQARFD